MHKLFVVIALFFLLFLSGKDASARTVYVTESFEITQRRGPTNEHRIVRMLQSGTSLEVLEENEGWLRVRSPGGVEGWVLKRFTMQEMPKSLQLERLQKEFDQLESASKGALDRIAELEKTNASLMNSLSETTNNFVELDQQYARLQTEAADVLSLREQYELATSELTNATARLDVLTTENQKLRSSDRMQWFLSGAGVVFVAWFFGFISGRAQRRQKSSLRF
jgi:SH3 domain protein